MDVDKKQVELAEMLERYELGLASLYDVYKRKFPEHEKFWDELATEERSHAFMVKSLRSMIEDGSLVFSPRPFTGRDVEPYLLDLNEHANYAMKTDFSMIEALVTALEMEGRVLEKDVWQPMDGDSEELVKILEAIVRETEGHHDRIEKLYEKMTGG